VLTIARRLTRLVSGSQTHTAPSLMAESGTNTARLPTFAAGLPVGFGVLAVSRNSARQSISGRSLAAGLMTRTLACKVLRCKSASPLMRVTSPLKTSSGSRLQRILTC